MPLLLFAKEPSKLQCHELGKKRTPRTYVVRKVMLTTSLIQLRQRNYKSREKNDAAIPFVIERLYFKQLDAYCVRNISYCELEMRIFA